jgi:uncharacterized SAM-binding protein YcdF (DUF218 family)
MTAEINDPPNSRQRPRAGKKIIFIFPLLITLISASIWFNREVLLREAAEQWIVSDDVRPADAAAIFGGNVATRPFAAAEYYHRGLIPKILVANIRIGTAKTLDVLRSETAVTRDVLIKLGVPETDIETFGSDLSNTHEEAVALREWVIRNHAKSVIVPTEDFSSRRVRWAVINALAGTGTAVQVDALNHPAYRHSEWWKNHTGLISFQNEVMKYVYYRLKY